MTDTVNVPEVGMEDAPDWYCHDSASGWACGWNACRAYLLEATQKAEPVSDDALKVAKDIHVALEKLIYGLPDYLASENLTDEENVIRDAQIALDVTAHRLAHIELAQPEAPKVEQEPSVRRTMTVDLSDVEMAALDDLIAKKDLSGPNVFRQALKLYQAVENGAASVTWFTKDHPATSSELLEALESIENMAPATCDTTLAHQMAEIARIAISKHKGPQS